MLITSTILGFLLGTITGFKSGLGQWRLLGFVGVLIEAILGIELLHIYPVFNFEYQMAGVVCIGGFLLSNAIAAPISAFFSS